MTPPPPVPRTPDDVLAAVVGVLGCWPAESLVLVGLGPRRSPGTVVRARLDLLLQGEPDDHALSLRVDAAAGPCAADGARGVVLLLLSDGPGSGARVMGAAAAALGRAGLALADAAVLRGARWTSARGSWTSAVAGRAPLGVSDGAGAPESEADEADEALEACAAAIAVLRAAGTAQDALDDHVLPAWLDAVDRVVARTAAPDTTAEGSRAPHDAAPDGAAPDGAALGAAAREALDPPLAAWLLLGLQDPARRDAVLASVLPGGRAALTTARPDTGPPGPTTPGPTTPGPTSPGPTSPVTRSLAVRDRWGRAVTGLLDAGGAGAPAELDAAAALLRRLAELAPAGARAEPLAVLAWWAWWRRRPEQAEVLAAQALAVHPGHGLAGLVLSCAGHRLVPAWARAGPREDPLDPARAVIYPPRRS